MYILKTYILTNNISMTRGKPSGIRTGRKLRIHRKKERWADKDYKKAHLGTRFKSNPFGGASHAKGIVLEKVILMFDLIINYKSFIGRC